MSEKTQDIYKTTLGYRLSKIRFELGLNKKQFAQKLNISQPTVTRYEDNEREPDYSFILILIAELKVNPYYVFGESDNVFINNPK